MGSEHDPGRRSGLSGDPAAQVGADAYEGFSVDDVVLRMLGNLQTKWTSRPLDDGSGTDYNFVFQRGDFHVLTRADRHVVNVHYLFFQEVSLGQLDNVRHACNLFNQHYTDLKAVYSVHAEHNKVHIHITAPIRLTLWNQALEDDFAELLSRCFEGARSYRGLLGDILKEDLTNIEERDALSERERYLAYEAEMKTAEEWLALQPDFHFYSTNELKLVDLLSMLCGDERADEWEFVSARVTTDCPLPDGEWSSPEFCETILPDKAALLNIGQYMLDDAEGELKLKSLHTIFNVEISRVGYEAEYLIDVRFRDQLEGTFYFKVEVVQMGGTPLPGAPRGMSVLGDSAHHSLTISFSPMPDEKKQAEFEYLWREAQDKYDRGESLSDDERFIMLTREPHVAYDLYWGLRFYLSRSYYHALMHLENAYNELHPHFHDLDKKQRREFFELSYFIGICYMRLHRPKLAYYYLDGLFNLNNIRYTQAYITAIVRSHDHRAIGIVNGVLSNVQRLYDGPEEPSGIGREELYEFLLFLRRSKAQVLIDDRRLDEAEDVLRKLLPDDKRHEAHLLEQLATVARLRAELAAAAADKSTRSVTSEFPKPEQKD